MKDKKQFSELVEILQYNIESENFYQTVFENAGIATVIFKKDNTILLVNGEFEKLTSYTRNEVEGKKKWKEFVYRKDDLEMMEEYHRLRLIDPLSAPHTYEFQLVNRNGQVKDIVATVATIPGTKQTLMTLLDITDRKRMEEALKESERRLADTIDFLPDATFAVDLSGKVIAWNKAIEKMTGIKPEDILGKGNYEYTMTFYGIRRPMLINLVFGFTEDIIEKYDFVQREGNVFLAETNVTIKGVFHTLWGKAGPLYDSRGNITGAIESVRDITEYKKAKRALQKAHDELEVKIRERTAELSKTNDILQKEIFEHKRTEATLKNSEQKFAAAFYMSAIPMAITEIKDGRYIDVNESFLKGMGLKYEEVVGNSSVGTGYIMRESRALFLEEFRQKGHVENLELPIRVKDGELRRGLFNSTKITIGSEDFFLTMVTDITEQK